MSKEEVVGHWSKSIIPAVFCAEDSLHKHCPEWRERLRRAKEGDVVSVADAYCRAIAEIIVSGWKED